MLLLLELLLRFPLLLPGLSHPLKLLLLLNKLNNKPLRRKKDVPVGTLSWPPLATVGVKVIYQYQSSCRE